MKEKPVPFVASVLKKGRFFFSLLNEKIFSNKQNDGYRWSRYIISDLQKKFYRKISSRHYWVKIFASNSEKNKKHSENADTSTSVTFDFEMLP